MADDVIWLPFLKDHSGCCAENSPWGKGRSRLEAGEEVTAAAQAQGKGGWDWQQEGEEALGSEYIGTQTQQDLLVN